MGRIKVGKQPYSDVSSHSLRDFLTDKIFEFNLFHKIAKRKLYTNKNEKTGESVIGDEKDPLSEYIKMKAKPKLTILERLLSKDQKKESIPQTVNEETNYFFIKRQEEEENIKKQYNAYLELTETLNSVAQDFYNKYKEAERADEKEGSEVKKGIHT